MSNPFKRFVSALIAIMMVITLVPTQAFAVSGDGDESESLVSAGSFDLDFVEDQTGINTVDDEMPPAWEETVVADSLSALGESDEGSLTIIGSGQEAISFDIMSTVVMSADQIPLTRSELCETVVTTLEPHIELSEDANPYRDIDENSEHYIAILICSKLGMFPDIGTSFSPTATVERGELAYRLSFLLASTFQPETIPVDIDESSTEWYSEILNILGCGVMSIDHNDMFRPHAIASKEDINLSLLKGKLPSPANYDISLDIAKGPISIRSYSNGGSVFEQDNDIYISTGNCYITQSSSSTSNNSITVNGSEVEITFSDLTITNESTVLKIANDAYVKLYLQGTNSLHTSNSADCISINKSEVTILGDGSLRASVGKGGTTAGGGITGGSLIVESGTVYAYGGNSNTGTAGIGITGESFIVKGGTVYAYGGKVTSYPTSSMPYYPTYYSGSGISDNISVEGGSVFAFGGDGNSRGVSTATGGIYGGAGIRGTLSVLSGNVEATGGYGGAGINATTIIDGGEVFAKGGNGGAGISGALEIHDGTVTAKGGAYSAGIGGSYAGSGYKVTISGGVVTAIGNGRAAGIGGGDSEARGGHGGDVIISGGTVNVTGGGSGAGIGGGAPSGTGGTVCITGGNVTVSGGCNAIGGGSTDNNYGCKSILIADGVNPNLSHVSSDGYDCQECITIKTQPINSIINAEFNMDFVVAAQGNSGLRYQWQTIANGDIWFDLKGQNSNELSMIANKNMDGWQYRCKITNAWNNVVYTNVVRLTVRDVIGYTTRYYLEKADGSGYDLDEQSFIEAEAGTEVSMAPKDYMFFTENAQKGTPSGAVNSESSLILSRYYDRNYYVITYDTNGGVALPEMAAKYGTPITLSTPSRVGYIFSGWYTDTALTEEYISATMPGKNVILYAKWNVVGEGRGIEYVINGITLRDSTYQSISSIPKGAFYAEVSVTNLSSVTMDTLLIATYDKDDRMLNLSFLYANPQIGQTFVLGTSIDNSKGEVAKIKAFVLPMLGGLTPLAEAVELVAT